jgi:lysophospholipase L1-like esterase
MEAEIWLLGIPCVSEMTFPGSQEEFHSRNNILRVIAKEKNTKFLQWAAPFFDQTDLDDEHFYRDGFHPNPHGAQMLAFQLFKEIEMVDSRA